MNDVLRPFHLAFPVNNIEFIIEPYTRFKDKKGEQSTMFIKDSSGNVIEFKAFINDEMIFEN